MTKKRSTKSKQTKKAPVSRSRKSVAPRQPRVRKKSTALAAPTEKPTTLIRLVRKEKERALSTRPIMLLVLGPHRSGTSLVTRAVECLGAENSSNLNPPNFANPKGYFEDWDIYQFNENILLPRLGMTWHSIDFVDWSRLSKTDRSRLGLQALEIVRQNYPTTRPVSVLKEPRMGMLLPFWLSVLGHAGFDVRIICSVRDPLSVARSLAARDGFSLTHGGMLYATSWLSILPHIEHLPVALADFDMIFDKPGKALRSVADKLQVPLPANFEDRLHEFTTSHLDPSLRHSHLPAEDIALEPDLPPIAVHLHQALLSAARSQNIRKASRLALASGRTIEDFRPVLAEFDQLLAGARQAAPPAPAPDSAAAPEATGAVQPAHEDLATQLAAAQAQREELAARLAAADVERQELQARQAAYASLQPDHADLSARHATLVAAFKELEDKYAAILAEHNSLQQERDQPAANLAELESLRSEIGARQTAMAEVQAKLLAAEEARDQVEARARAQGEENSQLLQQIHLLQQDLERQFLENKQLTQTSEDAQAKLGEALAEKEAQAAQLGAVEASRQELAARQAALAEVQSRLSALEEERDKLLTSSKNTADENELLLQQLHQVQEELEKYFLENRDLKQSAEQLQATDKAHTALTALHQDLADSHAQLVTRHTALVAERDDLATRNASLTTELEALRAEHSALATRHSPLVTAFEKLEGQHASLVTAHEGLEGLAARRLQELAKLGAVVVEKTATLAELEALATHTGENDFQIRRIEVLDSHELPPHRHLNLLLYDVQLPGRRFDTLPARLVEHHGRAGLGFLRPPGMIDPPLLGWVESGQDGDHSFMLVIPEDAGSKNFLQTAGGSDQYFVRFLASQLDGVLLHRHTHCPPGSWEAARLRKWLPVARSLVQQLEQRPSRLHYDEARVAPGKTTGTWSFDLSNVFFAGRSIARLAFEWRPAAHRNKGEILLRLAETSAPPLLAWPHPDGQSLAPEVAVKFEPTSWRGKTNAPNGTALEATDRAFVGGLVAELPVLVEKLAIAQHLSEPEKIRLLKSAKQAAAALPHLLL